MKKVAIITGGAKGIGAAIGYKLGTKGYAVVIADIDEKAGLYRLDHFTESSIDAMFVKTDVSSEIDVSNLMDKVYAILLYIPHSSDKTKRCYITFKITLSSLHPT